MQIFVTPRHGQGLPVDKNKVNQVEQPRRFRISVARIRIKKEYIQVFEAVCDEILYFCILESFDFFDFLKVILEFEDFTVLIFEMKYAN